MTIDTKIYKNKYISAAGQAKIRKLKKEVLRLTIQNSEMIDRLKDTGDEAWLKSEGILTSTNFSQMELFEDEKPMIYESPDGGKTVYGRRAGDYENRKLIKSPKDNPNQMELFED